MRPPAYSLCLHGAPGCPCSLTTPPGSGCLHGGLKSGEAIRREIMDNPRPLTPAEEIHRAADVIFAFPPKPPTLWSKAIRWLRGLV